MKEINHRFLDGLKDLGIEIKEEDLDRELEGLLFLLEVEEEAYGLPSSHRAKIVALASMARQLWNERMRDAA